MSHSIQNTETSSNKTEKPKKSFRLWIEPIIVEAEISITRIHNSIFEHIPPQTI